jgi:hypothetical protein
MLRCRVDIIRKRAEHLGTVEAKNEAERFDIGPERRNRINITKLDKKNDG